VDYFNGTRSRSRNLKMKPFPEAATPDLRRHPGPPTMTTATPYCRPGLTAGTPEEALDCACGIYLKDPTPWTRPLMILGRTYGRAYS
jgi:hypothetical protein